MGGREGEGSSFQAEEANPIQNIESAGLCKRQGIEREIVII